MFKLIASYLLPSESYRQHPLWYGLKSSIVLAVLVSLLTASSTLANNKLDGGNTGKDRQQLHVNDRVKASILIKAPPSVVWSSVLDYRRHDPEVTYLKPLSHNGDVNTIEEGFKFPTIFGSAECKLHFTEAAPYRIDFHLLESEDLKAMEGSWLIRPAENGQDSILELSSYVEPNMPIPNGIVNAIIQHRLDKRLNKVKYMAEKAVSKPSIAQHRQQPNE